MEMFEKLSADNFIRYLKRHGWDELVPTVYSRSIWRFDDKNTIDMYKVTVHKDSSLEEIKNAVEVIADCYKQPVFIICSEIYKCEEFKHRSLRVDDALLRRIVPKGSYCYDENGICPFWDKFSDIYENQNNGYCSYLQKGDWMHEQGTGLLWDQCKCCGINDE